MRDSNSLFFAFFCNPLNWCRDSVPASLNAHPHHKVSQMTVKIPPGPHRLLVAAIGNPSPQYDNTRHSIAYWMMDLLLKHYYNHFEPFHQEPGYGNVLISRSNHERYKHVVLAKTENTFMNLSGKPIGKAWNRFRLQDKSMQLSLVIVHDELDREIGKIQLRRMGSSARGHNGLKSITAAVGPMYSKIGVGINSSKQKVPNAVEFVLEKVPQYHYTLLEQEALAKFERAIDEMTEGRHIYEKIVPEKPIAIKRKLGQRDM